MATEETRKAGRPRRPLTALSRLSRLGDVPVVLMLAWAGWLAVPWSFSGLAQARAAAAAAAADTEPPHLHSPAAATRDHPPGEVAPAVREGSSARQGAAKTARHGAARQGTVAGVAHGRAAWRIPSVRPVQVKTPWPTHDNGLPGAPPAAPGSAAPHATAPVPTAPVATGPVTTGPDATGPDAAGPDAAGPDAAGPDGLVGGSQRGGGALSNAVDAVAVERARIAGVVHDAAGHGLAAIAMQAGIALVTLDDDPEQARASLRAIRETSTTALAQLRAALDGIDPPGGDLAGLIDGVRAAGLPVDVEPANLVVPAHLQGAVYRVVRESLTNVLRHAGPTRALVRAVADPREFVLEVSDQGAARTHPEPVGTEPTGPGWAGVVEGRGLAGMRARVTEAGGHFAAGPGEAGGFRVVARFPQVQA
ncbi:sensor histidine kinase [Nonomuraea sp. NPDC049709]|uniref:sensor histidine kinase n=1 Tax=Nonomuraea sp. NPDC049709 TaxID=3154736 RepID=UPI003419AB2B